MGRGDSWGVYGGNREFVTIKDRVYEPLEDKSFFLSLSLCYSLRQPTSQDVHYRDYGRGVGGMWGLGRGEYLGFCWWSGIMANLNSKIAFYSTLIRINAVFKQALNT